MKNLKFTLLVAVLACGICGAAFAGVTFLPSSSSSVGGSSSGNNNNNSAQASASRCRSAGYGNTSCASGLVLRERCPYNSSYYKSCCQAEYKYTPAQCTNAGLRASRNSCGGYYKCI